MVIFMSDKPVKMSSMIGMSSKEGFRLMAERLKVSPEGSSVTEDTQSVTDSATKVDTLPTISLPRDNDEDAMDSCQWAEENDQSVHNAISLHDNTMNNGFISFIDSKEEKDHKDKYFIEATEYLKEEISPAKDDLRSHVSALIRNHDKFGMGIGVMKKDTKGNDVIIDLDTRECSPVKNLETGRLGDGAGIGLDKEHPKRDIAIIQHGNIAEYNDIGTVMLSPKYFYFEEKNLLIFPNRDGGKLIGTSPARRVLRLVEIKLSLQNILALLAKRFGPQIYVQLGNKDLNIQDKDIPASYSNAKDSDGNQVDPDTARDNYKTDLYAALEESLKDWVNGDNIFQLIEFGIEIKTINPSSGMMDFGRYIQLMANFIKIGILDLDVSGRIDVTSGVMEEQISKDLKDKVGSDRDYIIGGINEKYVKMKLSSKYSRAVGIVKLKFNDLDLYNETERTNIEVEKSKAVYNYSKAGYELPDYIKREWNLEDIKKQELQTDQNGEELDEDGNPINKEEKEFNDVNKSKSKNPTQVEEKRRILMTQYKKTKNPATKRMIDELDKKR